MTRFLLTIIRKIKKKKRDIERYGFRKTLKKFLRDRVYDRKVFVVLRRDLGEYSDIYHKNYGYKKTWNIRFLRTIDEIREVGGQIYLEKTHWPTLLEQGCECVAAIIDGEMVAYAWYSVNDFIDPIIAHKFVLNSCDVFQFEGFVLPKYRGRPIPRDVLKYAHDYYYSRDYRGVVCAVDKDEKINIRLHKKLDFYEVGTVIHFRKILFLRRSWEEKYEGGRRARIGGSIVDMME